MYRAVLDTNVFVSGGTISGGVASQILDHWRNQEFITVVSPQLSTEYDEVLFRPKIMKYTGLSIQETRLYIDEIR